MTEYKPSPFQPDTFHEVKINPLDYPAARDWLISNCKGWWRCPDVNQVLCFDKVILELFGSPSFHPLTVFLSDKSEAMLFKLTFGGAQ